MKMNMWLAMLPSSRTSVLTKLHGIPFERTVRYHKMFTTTGMIIGVLHTVSAARVHGDKVNLAFFLRYNLTVHIYRI